VALSNPKSHHEIEAKVIKEKTGAMDLTLDFVLKIFKRYHIGSPGDLVLYIGQLSEDQQINFLKHLCYKINKYNPRIKSSDIETGRYILGNSLTPPYNNLSNFKKLFNHVLSEYIESDAVNISLKLYLLMMYYHILPDGNGRTGRLLFALLKKDCSLYHGSKNVNFEISSRPNGLDSTLTNITEIAIQELFTDSNLIIDSSRKDYETRNIALLAIGTDWEKQPQLNGDMRRLKWLSLVAETFQKDFYDQNDKNSLPILSSFKMEYLAEIMNLGFGGEALDLGTVNNAIYGDVYILFIKKIFSFFDGSSNHHNLIEELLENLNQSIEHRTIATQWGL